MSELIDVIIKTRKTAADILVKSLFNLDKNSEVEIREKILAETVNHSELFPRGWYDPPPSGIGILLDQKPFKRLQFNSLRDSKFWPRETSLFEKETVGIVYVSPVDKKTGMLGDIGFTIYTGDSGEIKEHIKKCYNITLLIAKYAKVGMKFSDLYKFAENLLKNNLKIIGWMTTTNDPNLGANLGHTVPRSFENNFILGKTFEEIKNTIRIKRIYINEVENFKISKTCAFTVETRLADFNESNLPNIFFHFIVCFDKGKKIILENFDKIFAVVGMDYMNSK